VCSHCAQMAAEASATPSPTVICGIFDRSGSMYDTLEAAIGGINVFLSAQRELNPKTKFNALLFNNKCKWLRADFEELSSFPEVTKETYKPKGTTALYDGIGKGIEKTREYVATLKQPHKVFIVIQTDGKENASVAFTKHDVSRLICECKALSWEFLFMGADQDSINTAVSMGIHSDSTLHYVAGGRTDSTRASFLTMSAVVTRATTERSAVSFGAPKQEPPRGSS